MSRPGLLKRLRHMNRLGDLTAAAIALLPAVIILGLFNIYPTFYSAYLSLLDWNGLSKERIWVGAQNYIDLFHSDIFWNSLKVTTTYVIGNTILGLAVGLLVALLVNTGIRGKPFYQAVYFIPVMISAVGASVVWRYMLDPGSGYVNVVLRALHIQGPAWLTSPKWAMPAVILVGVWRRVGFNMVIFVAGLQAIPRDYYEAAGMDGAGAWPKFHQITWPLLAPVTLLLAIMSVIDSLLMFDQVFVLTEGGPMGSTDLVGYRLYVVAFRYMHTGRASAMALIVLLIVLSVTLVQWRFVGFSRRGEW